MTAAPHDWPSALTRSWEQQRQADAQVRAVEGLLELIAALYHRSPAVDDIARRYVLDMRESEQPGWSAAGRAVWSLTLWRKENQDSALLQLMLAELDLQAQMRRPQPEPDGGPTATAAASNNLGVAYATLRMFELARPHLRRAADLSAAHYGSSLKLQVCADAANLAEVSLRWGMYANAVGHADESPALARQALIDVEHFEAIAGELQRDDALRYAQVVRTGARSLINPGDLRDDDRAEILDILEQPIFGDEPTEIVMRAVAARVCRLLGDAQGCREQARLAAAIPEPMDHASAVVAAWEAAALEPADGAAWTLARMVAKEAEATRRRMVSAFSARLTLAGLEQQVEQMSQERRRLQSALQEALRQEAELVHAATHDSMTGLPNRALFEQRLGEALSAQDDGDLLAVAFVDLDDFKAVNDSGGHAAGDAALCWVGDQLRRCTTPHDTVARLGGDEFAVLLTQVPSARTAIRWCRSMVADVNGSPERPAVLSISVGLCVVPRGPWPADHVLQTADRAMYHAKRQGKARMEVSVLA